MPTKREEDIAAEAKANEAAANLEGSIPQTEVSDDSEALAESGWYPHPRNPSEEFYWDGSAWTGASRLTKQPVPAQAQQANPYVDPVDQLQKLADLKEKGLLTAEEFETKKKILLDRL
jgi:hypothetical protein